jgi:hypothetical protein
MRKFGFNMRDERKRFGILLYGSADDDRERMLDAILRIKLKWWLIHLEPSTTFLRSAWGRIKETITSTHPYS